MIKRRDTRRIFIGNVPIGGGAPVAIQSMTNTATASIPATLRQIQRLAHAGCEIVRVAVPDGDAATALKEIAKRSPIPVIADIHFDYRLALISIDNGVHGIRINPGNIKNHAKLRQILDAAKAKGVVIRIGVNSGSLDSRIRRASHAEPFKGLAQSALDFVKFFEDNEFFNIKVSLKSTDVQATVAAYRYFADRANYPLHVGITEAGTAFTGAIRSAVGIGSLLLDGIGDTMRVSLTAPPVREIIAAKEILKACGVRELGPVLISCPTCARREIDVIYLANKIEKQLSLLAAPLKVAVMGCPVNGPGEAMEADIGLAGSRDGGVIFKHGRVLKRIKGTDVMLSEFIAEISAMNKEWLDGRDT